MEHPPLVLHGRPAEAVAVMLDAAPGAGLLWQPAAPPAGCSLAAQASQPGGAGEGGALRQTFVFSSPQAGRWTLRFELRRAWEAQPQAVQLVEVTVI